MMKHWLCVAAGTIGGAIASFFGGWTAALTVLLVCMGLDYVTGLLVAIVFHSSPKTESGGAESRAGFKGLVRKFAILAIVVVARMVDMLLGTEYIRDAVAIAFCCNEILSIIENVGLMGVPIPKVLTNGIDILKKRQSDSEDEGGESK